MQNGISYLQVQDGALTTVAKIVDRMAELRTMANDVTKNTQDIENYSKEFIELQRQLNQVRHEKFNGISLFSSSRSPSVNTPPDLRPQLDKTSIAVDDMGRTYQKFSRQILTTADGVVTDGNISLNVTNIQHMLSLGGIDTRFISTNTAVSISAARNAGGTGTTDASGQRVFINLGNINDGNKDDFTVAATKDEIYTSDGFLKSIMFISMGSFTDIIQQVADTRAENGAEQNRVMNSIELLQTNMTNLEAAHGRIMDADIALESTRFAKQNVLVQAGAAMTAQANQLTNVALQLLA